MAKPQVGEGRVEIEIDGHTGYLEPSLEACIEIDKMGGQAGLMGVAERCRNMHFQTLCDVLGYGLRVNGQPLGGRHKAELLPKAVYEAGVVGVAAKCLDFIHVLMNGGREVSDDDEDEPEEGSDDAPLG